MSNIETGLQLDARTINDATSQADSNLALPTAEENPTFRPGKKDGEGSWTESAKITATSLTSPADEPTTKVFNVTLQITPEISLKNAEKPFWYNQYIDMPAFGDPQHKHYKWNRQKLGKVNGFLTTFGWTVAEGEKFEYGEIFNGDKPLVGKEVLIVVRKYSYINKDTGASVPKTEIAYFLPKEQ